MCFTLGTVCWAHQEDADRLCLDTHDKIFFENSVDFTHFTVKRKTTKTPNHDILYI